MAYNTYVPTADYADFDLLITRIARGRYQAQVVDSPAGQASVEFKRPFSDTELKLFVLSIGRTRTGVRRLDSPEMQAAEAFGRKLFEAVFQAEVRERLSACLDQVQQNQIPGLRLKLRLANVPELANLPWEYLYHSTLRRFIVLSTQTPITRYIDLPQPVMPLTVTAPLRLLVMVTSPPDYPPLDVDREKAKMKSALRRLDERGLIVLEWLESATLFTLQQRLRQGPVHLFHFIGHGGWDEQAQDGVLLFEDEYGRGHRVSASRLAAILHDHRTLRLVVLNACEGARVAPTDPFAGVAATLIQQGIPAVLAMQFEITDRAAILLAQFFYESLADGYPAEAALAEARKAIYASGNDVEWGTPVLYLRAPDGRLFDLTVPSSREAERLAAQRAEDERLAREKAEKERPAHEKAESERLAAHAERAEQAAHEVVERRRRRRDVIGQPFAQALVTRARLVADAVPALPERLRRIPIWGWILSGLVTLGALVALLVGGGTPPIPATTTPTATPTSTQVPTLTRSPTPTLTRTPTIGPSLTPTDTPTLSHTSTNTATPTRAATRSLQPTNTPTRVPTATPTRASVPPAQPPPPTEPPPTEPPPTQPPPTQPPPTEPLPPTEPPTPTPP